MSDSPRILLVEDSEMISGALKILLQAKGYEVTVADTAAKAIAWDAPAAPALLLLDLTLPDADGLTVIDGLAGRGLKPVVTYAMTGHSDAATRDRCTAAGCDGVLIKPVPVQDLLRLVREKLE